MVLMFLATLVQAAEFNEPGLGQTSSTPAKHEFTVIASRPEMPNMDLFRIQKEMMDQFRVARSANGVHEKLDFQPFFVDLLTNYYIANGQKMDKILTYIALKNQAEAEDVITRDQLWDYMKIK